MAKARKRHVQQVIRFGDKRGGKRRKAGRPKQGVRASERHKKREALRKHEPVHVVIRANPVIGTMRRRDAYRAIRGAILTTFSRENFRIVHISIQGTHVHLLVEADDRLALAAGMQAFQISAAKRINAAIVGKDGRRRKGPVFTDRYHAQIIRTPRQAHNSLVYVLNNWRKHRENRALVAKAWKVDPFSSAPSFAGWKDVDAASLEWPSTYEPLPVWGPKTWLLREGWRKYGLISSTAVPSSKATVTVPLMAE